MTWHPLDQAAQPPRPEVKQAHLVDLTATILHETTVAWLISAGHHEVWLDKRMSQRNSDGTFTIPVWLAKERGLLKLGRAFLSLFGLLLASVLSLNTLQLFLK